MKKTQLQFVLERLKENGRVSRNDCLRHYVSRLGAYICDLRKEGYEFEAKSEGGDYVYILIHDPHQVKKLTEAEMFDLFEPKVRA